MTKHTRNVRLDGTGLVWFDEPIALVTDSEISRHASTE